MWILEVTSEQDQRRIYHLKIGQFVVGRKECDILVENDRTISRAHAVIHVEGRKSSTQRPALKLKDTSKFGTTLDPGKGKGVLACAKDCWTPLVEGNTIIIGQAGSKIKVLYQTLVFCLSKVPTNMVKVVEAAAKIIDASVSRDWQDNCTHLVMTSVSLTQKAMLAITDGVPIVTPEYCALMGARKNLADPLPDPKAFLPKDREEFCTDAAVFEVNPLRKTLFKGKVFIMTSPALSTLYRPIVKQCGGRTVEASVEDIVANEEFYGKHPEACYLEPGVDEQRMALEDYLEKMSGGTLAIVPSGDLGLAVLAASTTRFCNPVKDKEDEVAEVPQPTALKISCPFCPVNVPSAGIHDACALWANVLTDGETKDTEIMQQSAAIAADTPCSRCSLKFAGTSCNRKSCAGVFHRTCAEKLERAVFTIADGKTLFYCNELCHTPKVDKKFESVEVEGPANGVAVASENGVKAQVIEAKANVREVPERAPTLTTDGWFGRMPAATRKRRREDDDATPAPKRARITGTDADRLAQASLDAIAPRKSRRKARVEADDPDFDCKPMSDDDLEPAKPMIVVEKEQLVAREVKPGKVNYKRFKNKQLARPKVLDRSAMFIHEPSKSAGVWADEPEVLSDVDDDGGLSD